jgi:hypothetical protein
VALDALPGSRETAPPRAFYRPGSFTPTGSNDTSAKNGYAFDLQSRPPLAYTKLPHCETQTNLTSPGDGEPQDVSCFLSTEFSYSTLEGIAD